MCYSSKIHITELNSFKKKKKNQLFTNSKTSNRYNTALTHTHACTRAHLLYHKEQIILGVFTVSVAENNIKTVWVFLKFPKLASLIKGKGFFFSPQQLLLSHLSDSLTAQLCLCYNRRGSSFVSFVGHTFLLLKHLKEGDMKDVHTSPMQL